MAFAFGTADGPGFCAPARRLSPSPPGCFGTEDIRLHARHCPPDMLAALDGLPMGLLTKIALPRHIAEDRLGFDPQAPTFFRQACPRAAHPVPLVHPLARRRPNIAIGFIGGRAAWDFCARAEGCLPPSSATEIDAILLGPTARNNFATQHGLMTSLGHRPPLFHGAYAYATPGNADARKTLMPTPLWDGRLHLRRRSMRHRTAWPARSAGAHLASAASMLHVILRTGFPAGGTRLGVEWASHDAVRIHHRRRGLLAWQRHRFGGARRVCCRRAATACACASSTPISTSIPAR